MVDEHIKDCEAENIQAEKSHKGSFNIRLSPELHRRAAIFAKTHGISLNTFVKESIESKLNCNNVNQLNENTFQKTSAKT